MRFLTDLINIDLELLWALLLTLIIEGAAVLIIFRRAKYVCYSVLCNLLTNPALNLLLALSVNIFGGRAYYPLLITSELAVIFIEAAVYRYICGFGTRKSVLLSAVLNALSFAAGLLLFNYKDY